MVYVNKPFTNRNYIVVSIIFWLLLVMMTILQSINVSYVLLFLYWIYNTIFALSKLKSRIFLLIFNFTLFTFTLSRPIINILRGGSWFFDLGVLTKVVYILFFGQFCLFLGNVIYDKFLVKSNVQLKINNNSREVSNSILLLLIVSFIFNSFVQIYTYFALYKFDYALVYTSAMPRFNIIVRIMSSIFPYTVFAYLSTIPSKRNSYICLFLYVLTSVPLFLLGSRSDLVLRLLFSIVYFIIRCYIDNSEKWVTKRIIIISFLLIPLFIAFLGAYNYIRDGEKVESNSLIDLSLDFFYKQGTTFDTICQGVQHEYELKNNFNVVSYTIGEFIDYALHNTIAIRLFNTVDMGSGNNMNVIMYGNSMAHNVSYVVLGKSSYLSGHGRGTSYLIETYVDFNVFGVVVYSLFMGIFLSSVMYSIRKNNLIISLIMLTALSQVFLVPRYSSVGFLVFLIKPQFWLVVFYVLLIKYVFCKGVTLYEE